MTKYTIRLFSLGLSILFVALCVKMGWNMITSQPIFKGIIFWEREAEETKKEVNPLLEASNKARTEFYAAEKKYDMLREEYKKNVKEVFVSIQGEDPSIKWVNNSPNMFSIYHLFDNEKEGHFRCKYLIENVDFSKNNKDFCLNCNNSEKCMMCTKYNKTIRIEERCFSYGGNEKTIENINSLRDRVVQMYEEYERKRILFREADHTYKTSQ